MKLTAARSSSIRKFLKQGLPISLDIDGPRRDRRDPDDAGAHEEEGKEEGKKSGVAACSPPAKPSVALDGQVDLLLKPTKQARASSCRGASR